MATSQRLSRGFNRLALFLAAIPLLIGIVTIGFFMATDILRRHQEVQCAHAYITQRIIMMPDRTPVRFPDDMPDDQIRALILGKFPDIAKTATGAAGETVPSTMVPAHSLFAPEASVLNLKQIGCSDWDYGTVTYGEARNVYGSLFSECAKLLGIGLAITLGLTFAVYGVVRAIGWVIGGFAAA